MEKKAGGIRSRMRSSSSGRVRRDSPGTGMSAGRSGNGIAGKAVWMIKSLLCAYVVTGILLLVLTLLLYKMGLSEENVNAGIILIYVISTFAGGFVMGKLTGSRKFLWGLLAGVLYFVLLVLISLGLYHSLQSEISSLVTTFLLCAGGGMLGGMIA